MSFVYQAGVFTSIAINIGLADKQLQDELILVAGTAASYTKTARDYVATSLDSSSTDANTFYCGYSQVFKSTNKGANWTQITRIVL